MSKKRSKATDKDHLVPVEICVGTALCAEEDRGCVLVAYAQIERVLNLLLAKYFRLQSEASDAKIDLVLDGKGKNPQALLGSGWAKATIAFLVGQIDQQTLSLCDELRQLRNDFSHHEGGVILTDKAVARFVDLMPDAKTSIEQVVESGSFEFAYGFNKGTFSGTRIRFMAVCINLYVSIFIRFIRLDPPPYPTGVLLSTWEKDGQHGMSFIPIPGQNQVDENSNPPQ